MILKVVIFDDSLDQAERLKDLVHRSLSTDDILIVSTIPEANGTIKSGKLDSVDVFFVDLYFEEQASGMALIAMLRAKYPFTPIVAVSDTVDPADEVTALQRGATKFEFKRILFSGDFDPVHLKREVDGAEIEINRVTLVHISDVHATAGFDVETAADVLTTDVQTVIGSRGIATVDFLVCSGDVANSGLAAEYAIAQKFIDRVIVTLAIARSDVIVVPGNHDVDWRNIWYEWHSKGTVPADKKASSEEFCGGFIYPLPGKYPSRMDNYAQFSRYYSMPVFATNDRDHGWAVTSRTKRVQFLCFNSASAIDEFHPKRIVVPAPAVTACLEAANGALQADARANMLRIAVVHHPGSGDESISNPEFVERLSANETKFLLHGHVHELRQENPLIRTRGRDLHIVGCGTLGATKTHRPVDVPIMYNIIEIDRRRRKARVHTRHQRDDNGVFHAYAMFTSADPTCAVGSFDLDYN